MAGKIEILGAREHNLHGIDVTIPREALVVITGLSGSGKSTLANEVEQVLHTAGRHTFLLDGDNLRHGLNGDLGFSEADRTESETEEGPAPADERIAISVSERERNDIDTVDVPTMPATGSIIR